MNIDLPLELLFQAQFNAERTNSTVYEQGAWNLEAVGVWDSFAHFFHKSAQDELEHAEKIAAFLVERNAAPRLSTVEAPGVYENEPTPLVASALALEQENTVKLKFLYERSLESGDREAAIFLEWFLTEQRKSERELQDILSKLQRATASPAAMFIIDERVKSRSV